MARLMRQSKGMADGADLPCLQCPLCRSGDGHSGFGPCRTVQQLPRRMEGDTADHPSDSATACANGAGCGATDP
jgi:hypothetical protein